MPAKKRSAPPTKPAVEQPWDIARCRAIADRLDGYSHITSAVEARNAIRWLIAENERLAITVAAHTNGTAATLVRGIALTPARHR